MDPLPGAQMSKLGAKAGLSIRPLARRAPHPGLHPLLARKRTSRPLIHALPGNSFGDSVVVVGGGISGCATAKALSLVGIPVVILEQESGLRTGGTSIGLLPNAWRALDILKSADDLRAKHTTCGRVEFQLQSGTIVKSFSLDECGGKSKEFRGVKRELLLGSLSKDLPADCFRGNIQVKSIDTSSDRPVLHTSIGEIDCPIVIGCDGARSVIAKGLGLGDVSYAGYTGIRGIADFGSDQAATPSTIRLFIGDGIRWGMYGIGNNQFYWFVSFNTPQLPVERDYDIIRKQALDMSAGFSPILRKCVEATPNESLTRNSLTDRWKWPGVSLGKGCVTVCGDAMHPMTPNIAMGGAFALEDAVVLAHYLKRSGMADGDTSKLPEILRQFEIERTKRVMPLVIQSHIIGAIMQTRFPPVVALRKSLVLPRIDPKSFFVAGEFDAEEL